MDRQVQNGLLKGTDQEVHYLAEEEIMRQPAVADRFYPGSPNTLEHTISGFLPAEYEPDKKSAIAVVSPHAGYVYSGELAAKTLASVKIPKTVIIIGPNHHGAGSPIALSAKSWSMPFGSVPVDTDFSTLLLANSSQIKPDEIAHNSEHSLEVQIPFLQYFQKELSIVPLAVSDISLSACREFAEVLVQTIKQSGKSVLFVASTDMSHYESRESAERKDGLALRCIKELEPEKLYYTVRDNNISMCGVLPVTITLFAAKILGATSTKLVGYTDSGYVSGDSNQVVGYAGLSIS